MKPSKLPSVERVALGHFDTIEEARDAYLQAQAQIHGEFAHAN
jgi:hypothetical protein